MSRRGRGRGCPVCGSAVKPEKLRRHMTRVHGTGPVAATPRPAAPARRLHSSSRVSMRRIGIPVLAVIVIVVIAFLYTQMPRAVAFVDHAYYDMGDVPQTTRSHTFTLENRGNAPLGIDGATTSCGCTTVQISTLGGTSPPFGMPGHGAPVSWSGRVEPGETAEVRVIYDSTAMSGYYEGTRDAFVNTGAGELRYVIQVHEVP